MKAKMILGALGVVLSGAFANAGNFQDRILDPNQYTILKTMEISREATKTLRNSWNKGEIMMIRRDASPNLADIYLSGFDPSQGNPDEGDIVRNAPQTVVAVDYMKNEGSRLSRTYKTVPTDAKLKRDVLVGAVNAILNDAVKGNLDGNEAQVTKLGQAFSVLKAINEIFKNDISILSSRKVGETDVDELYGRYRVEFEELRQSCQDQVTESNAKCDLTKELSSEFSVH